MIMENETNSVDSHFYSDKTDSLSYEDIFAIKKRKVPPSENLSVPTRRKRRKMSQIDHRRELV